MAATSESAEMSGSFWRGPASWNMPTPSIVLGGKNLCGRVNYINIIEGRGARQTQVLQMQILHCFSC